MTTFDLYIVARTSTKDARIMWPNGRRIATFFAPISVRNFHSVLDQSNPLMRGLIFARSKKGRFDYLHCRHVFRRSLRLLLR
jgi:hypothetical protein